MDRWGRSMQGFHKLVWIDPSAPAAFVILSEIRWQWPFNSLRGEKWNGQIFHPLDLLWSAICLFFSLCWQWLMLPRMLKMQNREVSPSSAFCPIMVIFGTVIRYCIQFSFVKSESWTSLYTLFNVLDVTKNKKHSLFNKKMLLISVVFVAVIYRVFEFVLQCKLYRRSRSWLVYHVLGRSVLMCAGSANRSRVW